MASKINSEWWTVPENPGYYAYSTNEFSSNFDKFNFVSMSTMDHSIVPWGMGYCAAAATSWIHLEKTGTAWTNDGKLAKIEPVELVSTNNPIAIWNGYQSPYNANPWYLDIPGFRWIGALSKSQENKVYSTAEWDLSTIQRPNEPMPPAGQKMQNYRPIVYLDYQNIILKLISFGIYCTKTHSAITINSANFVSWTPPTGTTWDDWQLVRINYASCYRSSNTWNPLDNGSTGGYFHIWSLAEFDNPEDLQGIYFGDVAVSKISLFQRYHSTIGGENDSDDYILAQSLPTESNWQSPDQYYLYRYFNMRSGRYVSATQQFSDISYKQIFKIFKYDGSELGIGDNLPTSSSTSDRLYPIIYYDIKDYDGESPKLSAWEKIALHELSFYGLPIYNTMHGVSPDDKHIGDDWYYLPDFDFAHMITNGNYYVGSDALSRPNASWSNIFDDSVPEWDPNYFPPIPGSDDSDNDFGDLTNIRPSRTGTSGTKKFICSATDVVNLQSYLNGTYIPTEPDFWADFKGTNPQDYIVSAQRYPFPLPHLSSQKSSIKIGRVDTGIQAYEMLTAIYSPAQISAITLFDFGNIFIPEYYGDFRDYLSKITLFLPFIGSVDLDPRLYIGHTLGLSYIVDYDTGSIAAEIKRDALTMETKTSQISITIPFFAANMGAYQNALAQIQYSIEQSKIKQIAGIASMALSVGGALAGAASGMSDIGGASIAGGLIGGTASMFSGANEQASLQYQLEHTAPEIGTLSVAAPANAFFLDDRARLLIVRPKMLKGYDAASYSHVLGNACAIPGKIISFSGYTVAAAADLSGITARDGSGSAPTSEERRLIKQALQAGVYV